MAEMINRENMPRQARNICCWKFLYEKVAEVLLTNDGTEIQVQGQTSSPAARLVGRGHSNKLLLWHVKTLYFYDRKYLTFNTPLKHGSTGGFNV
jgi:hypothetical protein